MRDIAAGLGHLARGFGFWGRRPKVMALGMLPGLLASLLIGAALLVLAFNIVDIAGWLTGFADGWVAWLRSLMRLLAGIVTFAVALWLSIVAFTALVLIIGDPFYEAISAKVEEAYGAAPSIEQGLLKSIANSIKDALRLVGKSIVAGVVLFLLGMIPIIGPVIALIGGAVVGGWFLTVELSAYAFNRRGLRYQVYRERLAKRRLMAIVFGSGVFLLFLIPLGAVIVMPAAVAGATLLARDVMGEPYRTPLAKTAEVPHP